MNVTLYGHALHQTGEMEAPADMEVNGMIFPVKAMVEIEEGVEVPLLDIRMMSDFTWQLGALEGRLADSEGYARVLGEDVAAVIASLRQWLRENLDQATEEERQRFERVAE